MKIGTIEWIVLVLVILGGLNWGVYGIYNYNLIDALFGFGSTIGRTIYDLIGLASIWLIFMVAKLQSRRD